MEAAIALASFVMVEVPPDLHRGALRPSGRPQITPLLYVDAIESVIPFWVGRLDFEIVVEVPEEPARLPTSGDAPGSRGEAAAGRAEATRVMRAIPEPGVVHPGIAAALVSPASAGLCDPPTASSPRPGHSQAHRESDVDIGVVVDRARMPRASDRAEFRVRLISELIAVLHRNEVDLIILNDVPPGLGRPVVMGGERVFCSDPESDRRFVRDVQLRAADLDPFLKRMKAIKLERLRS